MTLNRDPEAAHFVTEDIDRFWQVFPHLDDRDAEERFEHDYIQAGTPGLHAFLRYQIETVGALLLAKVRACRAYYASVQASTLAVAWFIPQFKDSFRYLAGLYQEAVFPDTTFVIGRMNCGGTVDVGRYYIFPMLAVVNALLVHGKLAYAGAYCQMSFPFLECWIYPV